MDARCQEHWHPGRTLKREEGALGQTSQGMGQACWATTPELTNTLGRLTASQQIKELEEVISSSVLRLPAPLDPALLLAISSISMGHLLRARHCPRC